MKKLLAIIILRKFHDLIFYYWFFALMLFTSLDSQAQVELIKDINTNYTQYNEFVDYAGDDDVLYFVTYTDQFELWKKDVDKTVSLKKFASITSLNYTSDMLFFVANDGLTGNELWKSDGTEAGTVQVKDIAPGSAGSNPNSLTYVNNILFFVANDGRKGNELWKSNGTEQGTMLVKDIMGGGGHCNCRELIAFNNTLFFVARSGFTGSEVWQSDGSAIGTRVLKDISKGKTGSAPSYLTVSGSVFYFSAMEETHGPELWKSDGTRSGTVLVTDIRTGSEGSKPRNLIDVNGTLFFSAADNNKKRQLWKSNGTAAGTTLITIPYADVLNTFSWVNGMRNVNGKLYFKLGREVFKTDGITGQTQLVYSTEDFYSEKEMVTLNDDLYMIDNSYGENILLKMNESGVRGVKKINYFDESGYYNLKKIGSALYLTGNLDDHQKSWSLLKSDGTTERTTVVFDLVNYNDGSYPSTMTEVNGTLFFAAFNGTENGLWKSDGTEIGTTMVQSFEQLHKMVRLNNDLILTSIQDFKYRLWKTNGTLSGTTLLKEFAPSYYSYLFPEPLSLHDNTFLGVYTYENGLELWKTDGTTEGTQLVADINTQNGNSSSSNPKQFTPVGNEIFFIADDGIHGYELWRTDGTEIGTALVKDISTGIMSTYFSKLANFNGVLYFTTNSGELWKSDGSPDGTLPVASTEPWQIFQFGVINDYLYFIANDLVNIDRRALWKMGSDDQTAPIADIGASNDFLSFLGVADNRLFISGKDPSNTAHSLIISDGTTQGTLKLADVSATMPIAINHNYYFFDESRRELWTSDGSICGTFKITGNKPYYYAELSASGNNLFATLFTEEFGVELYRVDQGNIKNPCAKTSERITGQPNVTEEIKLHNDVLISQYPNPFARNFTLRVNGTDTSLPYEASIIQVNGLRVEHYPNLNRNTDYALGSGLSNGLYLLRIKVDGKVVISRISKQN